MAAAVTYDTVASYSTAALRWLNSWRGQLLLILTDAVLNLGFIYHGPFHAIDWKAYMDQVETIKNGERNYDLVTGRTGPLVYPGGHVALHWVLHTITNAGRNIVLCQMIFVLVQMTTSAFVARLYWNFTEQPFLLCLPLLFTVRCRNVFVNGLFNDCWTVMLVYAGLWLGLVQHQWCFCFLFYSAAVSIKMSALLFAPGVAIAAYRCLGSFKKLVVSSLPATLLQLCVGAPFLLRHPLPYIRKSFEFDRQFFHFLSHNLKWLPQHIFLSRSFQAGLLIAHVLVLVFLCWRFRWLQTPRSSKQDLLVIVWLANFVGIVFSRSLHYSFYSWYFHTLPLLAVRARWPLPVRYACLLVMEVCWNVWTPYRGDDEDGTCASPKASFVLTVCHLLLLACLLLRERPLWLRQSKDK